MLTRRSFFGWLGAAASLPVVGKFINPIESAAMPRTITYGAAYSLTGLIKVPVAGTLSTGDAVYIDNDGNFTAEQLGATVVGRAVQVDGKYCTISFRGPRLRAT
jgi:hypothetical protein